MSMTMTAYKNSSETTVVQKSITQIGTSTYTVTPTDPFDAERPTFKLSYAAELLECNYIKIAELGIPGTGKYFFAWVSLAPGGELIINCLSDPLMSYWAYIQNCPVLITRSESAGAPTMYPDSMLPVYPSKKNITSIVMQHSAAPLSGDLSTTATDSYLLTVIGGQPIVNGGE